MHVIWTSFICRLCLWHLQHIFRYRSFKSLFYFGHNLGFVKHQETWGSWVHYLQDVVWNQNCLIIDILSRLIQPSTDYKLFFFTRMAFFTFLYTVYRTTNKFHFCSINHFNTEALKDKEFLELTFWDGSIRYVCCWYCWISWITCDTLNAKKKTHVVFHKIVQKLCVIVCVVKRLTHPIWSKLGSRFASHFVLVTAWNTSKDRDRT